MRSFTGAICENHRPSLEFIEQQLSALFEMNHFRIRLETFEKPAELLKKVEDERVLYDVLFMDIEMPEINGVEVCRRVRLITRQTLIVFITNRDDFVYQTFEVQPFRFIRKNHFKDEVPPMVAALTGNLKEQEVLTVPVTEMYSGTIYNLDVHHIIYVEAQGRYCRIVSANDRTLQIQYRLKDMAALLTEHGFLSPHRSYLVNCRYIYKVEKEQVVLDGGESLPLARSCRDEFRAKFLEYMSEE